MVNGEHDDDTQNLYYIISAKGSSGAELEFLISTHRKSNSEKSFFTSRSHQATSDPGPVNNVLQPRPGSSWQKRHAVRVYISQQTSDLIHRGSGRPTSD